VHPARAPVGKLLKLPVASAEMWLGGLSRPAEEYRAE